jgi:hypothetical protein
MFFPQSFSTYEWEYIHEHYLLKFLISDHAFSSLLFQYRAVLLLDLLYFFVISKCKHNICNDVALVL